MYTIYDVGIRSVPFLVIIFAGDFAIRGYWNWNARYLFQVLLNYNLHLYIDIQILHVCCAVHLKCCSSYLGKVDELLFLRRQLQILQLILDVVLLF